MPAGSGLEDHRGNSRVCFLDLLFQFVSQKNNPVQRRRLVTVPTPTPNRRRNSRSTCLPPPTPTLCDLSSDAQCASSRDGGSGLDTIYGTSRHHTRH